MPFLGQGTHTAFVNQGGDQRNFTRQGSVQALDKARFRRGNARKSKGFFVAGREKLGSGRADSASTSKNARPLQCPEKGRSSANVRPLCRAGTRPLDHVAPSFQDRPMTHARRRPFTLDELRAY